MSLNSFSDVANLLLSLLNNYVLPLLVSLAVIAFVWGVSKYILKSDSQEERAKGRDFMIWGIVALFVLVSVWGLVNILTNTFGLPFVFPFFPKP